MLDALLKFNPVSLVADFACNALGIDGTAKAVIKGAAGVLTGNPLTIIDAGKDLLTGFAAPKPAQTQYWSPTAASPFGAQPGYAPNPAAPANPLDPSIGDYREALSAFKANFATFDQALIKDGAITHGDLQAILNSPGASAELKRAAKFLVDHTEYFNRADNAGFLLGFKDGLITPDGVDVELMRVEKDIARYGLPKPTSAAPKVPKTTSDDDDGHTTSKTSKSGSTTKTSSKTASSKSATIKSIVNSKTMSTEDKLQAILMALVNKLDDELLATTQQLDEANDKASKGDAKKNTKAETSQQSLELKLQKLIERRTQMFTLMSNLSSKFNEMTKSAISNMGKA
jgi:hypothetical protein